MGRRLQLRSLATRPHRTVAAFLLTVVAVAVPSGAWFVAGMRELDREALLAEDRITGGSLKKAVVLAERLAARFELLRETESRRPFYHYQNLFHDPRGAAEGASVSISPLAQSSADPLIEAHFQVDADGHLTLPTLNDQFPELGLHIDEEAQCALLAELEDVAFFCSQERGQVAYLPRSGPAFSDPEVDQRRVEVLSERAWRQHLRANTLYADLKAGKGGPQAASGAGPTAAADRIEIPVSPFAWYTLPVGGEPGLVALRSIDTPAGLWTQGFVISREAVRQYLGGADDPAAFVPLGSDSEPSPGQVAVAIDGTPWGVAIDLSQPLAEAVGWVDAERGRFLRFFVLGALAAALAGLLVVAMVYQSERLALVRAQFAASAAHELRTPLAGLRLYGEMLAEGLGDPARARDYARRLAAEAERLGRVVTNVLSFTRLERGSVTIQPQPGDLAQEVAEACSRLRPALEGSGAGLRLEVAEDLPVISFDRDAVAHILQNLLDNAEKYTRGAPDREICVRLANNGSGAELSVTDHGDGVPPSLRPRLFKPFSRGHEEDSPEGLGLGLVLVKSLAEAQGGKVRYRDGDDGGAVFTVTLPAAGAA